MTKGKNTAAIYALRAKIVDKSRRQTPDGRALHACCLCDKVAPWSDGWRWYGSYREEEEGWPIMKFCPSHVGPDIQLMVRTEDVEAAFLREYV